MEIKGIEGLSEFLEPGVQKQDSGFADVLSQGIRELNQSQHKAVELGHRLAAGENVELHDVMIAGQEAEIAMRLTVQLRNQTLDAYREVLRMQV